MSAIRCHQLSLAIGKRQLLSNISLELPGNKLSVLLGPSGSGKTSFLRVLNRLHDDTAGARVSGELTLSLSGQTIHPYHHGTDPVWLRRRVGMVFQHPNLLPGSIGHNLRLPVQLVKNPPRAELAQRIEAALREAQLWDEVCMRLDAPAASLSGGQQQRLCLARALILQPEILLLDEPTVSLDTQASSDIEALITSLKCRYTLVMVSHNPVQAKRLADKIIVFRDGSLVDS
ncbi:phosphate ABC transporter ATP-binding protein [Craterilacuibacter sinensis]|uniref:ATP-binding cassette domain-containing protein n=1 Tax=Craterilacuibacter sinensis TaxID=2686017 RepID=A0A845BGZ2_9NEIS|nr:phosphate ABC transporter ATP-binding protein [Craterilacuibacter sinensis]MXR35382.1 ATP-binding cassette domain-containing protein [Craterilacuibacter sinensis]